MISLGAEWNPSEEGVPRISILVPVFNGVPFLDAAIQSIRDQSLRDIEIIVIDDGSTDGSLDVIHRHAAADQRVRVVAQRNQGVAAARNHGIEISKAQWIALHDQDDIAVPQRLERQLTYLTQHPSVKALGTHGWRIGAKGQFLGVFDVGPRNVDHFLRLRTANEPIFLLASSVVFSRGEAVRLGMFRALWGADDVDLWTRIADNHPVVVLPERLVLYRVHAKSLSNSVFFRQMQATSLISVNASRRRAGLSELSFDRLRQRLKGQPAGEQARRILRWNSQYCYRVAGGYLADRQWRGLPWLAASVLIWPPVPFGRIRRQIVPWMGSRHRP